MPSDLVSRSRGADARTLVARDALPDAASQRPPSHHYETLDALRGVAALSVLLLHTEDYFLLRTGDHLLWPDLARNAYLAVDLFFVLSGFVVAHAYEARLQGGLPARRFLKLRMIRLYPLHLAGILVGTAAGASGIWAGDYHLSPGEIALAMVMGSLLLPWLFARDPFLIFPLNPPAWSLFFEVLASVAFGLAHRWLSQRVLITMVAAAGFTLCVKAAVMGTIDGGVYSYALETGLARVFFSFPLGVLLYRWRAHIPARLGAWGPWPLLAILFAMCLSTVPPPWRGPYDLIFVALVAPLLVAAGSHVSSSRVARPFFLAAGAISYPLYILHEPLRGPLLAAAEGAGFEGRAGAVIYLLLIIGIASAAAPADAAVRRRMLGRRSGRPVGQASART